MLTEISAAAFLHTLHAHWIPSPNNSLTRLKGKHNYSFQIVGQPRLRTDNVKSDHVKKAVLSPQTQYFTKVIYPVSQHVDTQKYNTDIHQTQGTLHSILCTHSSNQFQKHRKKALNASANFFFNSVQITINITHMRSKKGKI